LPSTRWRLEVAAPDPSHLPEKILDPIDEFLAAMCYSHQERPDFCWLRHLPICRLQGDPGGPPVVDVLTKRRG
jgi:hypothetical protein